ncbi:uncharacterized protein F5Z01DRAFT_643766 [Emericellopsis atlantica]|uniref:CFEM domain-containing protein n=1 Tax=Emericellopsis atlantica TaxID=2614577 RepID=A0A9P7ZUK7_9HYPO|nr:uncharacterized protein F5Z01DRAFT_643766 [Emericellopsis atlantica]KAG9258623.1 hypothetical protein F5Z01DRAFT_643766 [Emericellopsis atlantica]
MTTSTIFTTTVKTITSCGPEVTNCPADGTPTGPVFVTETVAVSTTVCPVTEVNGGDKPTTAADELPESPKPTTPAGGDNQTPDLPDLELPCPDVVPKCMNTFLHKVKDCKDNLDAACFCPDKDFVEETYQCLYAHGETDDIVSEAVQFFQGFCAPYIPKNPAIVTGPDAITSCITVTGTPTVTSIPYTTIVVETTVTEPCVSEGVTITSSSTVRTISTEITVPEVEVPTITRGPTASNQLPVATETGAVPQVPETGAPQVPETGAPQVPAEPTGIYSTLLTTKPIAGTGGLPIPSPSSDVPIPGAASNVRAGMGLGLVVMAVAAAL